MTCNVIATGSKGNAIQLDGNILLDCGVPFKALRSVARDLRLVLLTHIHGDHFNHATISRLAQERPLLRFGCGEWLVKPLLDCGVSFLQIDLLTMERELFYELSRGDICHVTPFPLLHDVENCGYKITLPNGERALYATDTGSMDGVEAKDFDLYMVEANYEQDDLRQRMEDKLKSGEFSHEPRVAATHLSKEQADLFLMENAGENSKYIYLHGHKDY